MRDKINLLVITDTHVTGVGGSENHIRSMIKWLPANKYNIFVVQLEKKISAHLNDQHIELLSLKHLHLFHLPLIRIYGLSCLQAYFSLLKILRNHQINISISFHEKADIINAMLPDSVFKISSRRDMVINPSGLLLWLRKSSVSRFNMISAPCKAIIDFAASREECSFLKQVIISNGLNVDLFTPSVQPCKDIVLLGEGAIVGICVGNFKEVKGHTYLIRAFRYVVDSFPNGILFLVGGDQGTRAEVEGLIVRYGLENNVKLLGSRSDIFQILTACNYIVSSSLSEGLSNSLIEGISCGLPAVATDVGGSSEIVKNGVNGFLVPAGDCVALAKAISNFYKDPQGLARMSLESRKLAVEKFDIRKNILKYDSLFTEITQKSHREQ